MTKVVPSTLSASRSLAAAMLCEAPTVRLWLWALQAGLRVHASPCIAPYMPQKQGSLGLDVVKQDKTTQGRAASTCSHTDCHTAGTRAPHDCIVVKTCISWLLPRTCANNCTSKSEYSKKAEYSKCQQQEIAHHISCTDTQCTHKQ